MIGFRKTWYGKEIEGRFSDVETFFIAEFDDTKMKDVKAPHVYICSPATKKLVDGGKNNEEWAEVMEMIDKHNKIVSIEVTPGMLEKIPPMVRIKTHILYMIEEKDASLLKDNDSIKVVHGDYNLFITSVQNMQKVTPDDYKFDRIEE